MRIAKSIAFFAAQLLVATTMTAQNVVKVGSGSYASYAPLSTAKSTEHSGDQSQYMQYRKLWVTERDNQPIPTNDWWTNTMVQQYSGRLWAYPILAETSAKGVTISCPSYWIDNGTEMKSHSSILIGGKRFTPESTVVDSWHDWDVELLLKQNEKQMYCTLVHGAPFTWIECKNQTLVLTPQSDDNSAVVISSTGKVTALSVQIGSDIYGIYLPKGATVEGDVTGLTVNFADGPQYIIVGLIKDAYNLTSWADYAYNIPTDTKVDYAYDATSGIVHTYWNTTTKHLEGAPVTSNKSLAGFLPHHYREAKPQFQFESITYPTPRGEMKMAEGTSFQIDFPFYGMLPYYALPEDSGFDSSRMIWLVDQYATQGGFGTDTYWGGKGLEQMALNMMFAREMGNENLFDTCRQRLRAALENWYTYTPGESNMYFNYVPRWGGMVGQNTSYDSDTFNDHHFHYGYFTYASALLALVDDDFREKYGDMMTIIAKDYANWDRTDSRFPWMRCFDPWAGHSFAGGLGDGGGNGQESSSEAMQGWGGLYLLGVALGNNEMRDAGLFGWVQEARGVAEYWFDRSRENIDYTKFNHPYNSNLTCHGVGWWTYFSGDPVWMHAIQWMPVSPCLDYLSEDKAFAAWDYQTMWDGKEITGWDGELADASLGNVLLSYLQRSDPEEAATIFDQLWDGNHGVAKDVDTGGITYFVTHSHLTYGDLDFHTTASLPTAKAFNKDGEYTYMAYNPSEETQTVHFYRDGTEVYSLEAAPRQLTVSGHESQALNTIIPVTDEEVDPLAGLNMHNIALGKKCTVSSFENSGCVAENATDGDQTTRWGSEHKDGERITVDLGEEATLHHLRIHWEAAYPSQYKVETWITDESQPTQVSIISSDGGWDEIELNNVQARYIRIIGTKRATQYGISLYELEAYGKTQSMSDDELMGIKLTSDDDVLKQNNPTQLYAKGYTCGGEWVDVTPEWSTIDGTITKNGLFTPSKYGNVNVSAKVGDLTATIQLPVEEALRVTSLSVSPTDIQLIQGQSKHIDCTTTNQFGGPIDSDQIEWNTNGDDCTITKDASGVTFSAEQSGDYVLTASVDTLSASTTIRVRPITEVNLAQGKTVECSGYENGGTLAENAVDGDATTRWGSLHQDGEWLMVDLGANYDINKVRILWEAAYASSYLMEYSEDAENWNTLYKMTNCTGGTDEHTFADTKARYVRFTGLTRHTQYGYSFYELEIYGSKFYDETPTSILSPAIYRGEGETYNLAGQRVGKMQKGVYIKDGRKVVKQTY